MVSSFCFRGSLSFFKASLKGKMQGKCRDIVFQGQSFRILFHVFKRGMYRESFLLLIEEDVVFFEGSLSFSFEQRFFSG